MFEIGEGNCGCDAGCLDGEESGGGRFGGGFGGRFGGGGGSVGGGGGEKLVALEGGGALSLPLFAGPKSDIDWGSYEKPALRSCE